MFLSLSPIDIGNDPDRPSPGRDWLRNVYSVHQRLCMAFPSSSRKVDDPDFLAPFVTGDFGHNQVRVQRGEENGFLFRIDPSKRGEAAILVRSAVEPDLDYAFHNAAHFLAASTQAKQVDASFEDGQSFRFRLMANPTRKIDTKSGPDGTRRNGKRVPVHKTSCSPGCLVNPSIPDSRLLKRQRPSSRVMHTSGNHGRTIRKRPVSGPSGTTGCWKYPTVKNSGKP